MMVPIAIASMFLGSYEMATRFLIFSKKETMKTLMLK